MSIAPTRFGLMRMRPRSREQSHRAASPLELLFDLVFVIAVSQAAQGLHGMLAAGQVGRGVAAYLMVFFAVWWAWMNFTWFASAFDTDDWAYRLMTVAQMLGVLVLAAGVPAAMSSYDFTVVTAGYVLMRLAMVGQWVRAGVSDAASRRTAFTYAVGIVVVQAGWVARLVVGNTGWQFATFLLLVLAEIAVPVVAERSAPTPWHPHHIADRYGCFTIILLGEGVLASSTAVFTALDEHEQVLPLIGWGVVGLLLVAGIWWLYFAEGQGDRLAGAESAGARPFVFGYVHYLLFAAGGAVSAGIECGIDVVLGEGTLGRSTAGFALSLPVAVFVATVWAVLLRGRMSTPASGILLALSLVLALVPLVPVSPALSVALVLVLIVVVREVDAARRPLRPATDGGIPAHP